LQANALEDSTLDVAGSTKEDREKEAALTSSARVLLRALPKLSYCFSTTTASTVSMTAKIYGRAWAVQVLDAINLLGTHSPSLAGVENVWWCACEWWTRAPQLTSSTAFQSSYCRIDGLEVVEALERHADTLVEWAAKHATKHGRRPSCDGADADADESKFEPDPTLASISKQVPYPHLSPAAASRRVRVQL
jgi:hypothetical protein